MKHKEWRGDKELIEKLLKESGLDNDTSELKRVMKCIIWCRYVEFMTTEEALGLLATKYEIFMSHAKYYYTMEKAIKILEKYQNFLGAI